MLLNEINDAVQETIRRLLSTNGWRRYEGVCAQELQQQLSSVLGQTTVQLASSGTAAVEILLRAAGVGAGDEVIIAGYDYPGNFWAIERSGARPVLVDVASGSWAIDQEALSNAYRPSCKAIIASHLHGELAPIKALREWCDERGVLLIEDACQAIGALLDSNSASPACAVGSVGHAAVVSFGGGKILCCGRGGAWATSDETLAQRGKIAAGAGSGPYGMSEIQAALISAQLPWLEAIHNQCRAFFKAVDAQLQRANFPGVLVARPHLATTAFYQAGWLLPTVGASLSTSASSTKTRNELVASLRSPSPQESNQRGADGVHVRQADGRTSGEVVSSQRHPDGTLHLQLNSRGLPFGEGFPGFHRRSGRRCRLPATLTNTAIAAEQTLVLHHRVAIEECVTAEEVASRMIASAAL
jgi:perosamine synthetase